MTKTKSKKNMIKKNKMDEKQEKEQLTMKKNKKIFIITFVICISILAIFLVKKTLQNDTFYTIKIGKLILENGIDMKDHLLHFLVCIDTARKTRRLQPAQSFRNPFGT